MDITRRGFIGTGTSVLASIAAGSPIRSSIGGRFDLEGGQAQPYYSEVEYLESTGTQWIDTELYNLRNPSNSNVYGMRVEAEVAWTHIPTTREVLCGLYKEGAIDYLLFSSSSNPSHWGRSSGTAETSTTISIVADKVVSVTSLITSTYSSLYVDGVDSAGTVSINLLNLPSFPIFAIRSNAGIARFAHARVYGFRMRSPWLSTYQRDFVPVRFTNEYGELEGALYDRIYGTIYRNQGSGSFIIGPDV